ncbi:hypothetical protein BCU68_01085 [Vibrio sp. 10N.286.49.B3]|uniref:hypothetical protein n=1 Tax=Vibrio sp. 10N.286.49.B3 TaxID=1880855 RepID=UPI000C85D93C|nr:hypothetical protein [Vibrio sp. 10N.286.49.B3]PMH46659.1 hypothetical protein BCU68_01085 [Vibrio sp. 10N.286.49.B3]
MKRFFIGLVLATTSTLTLAEDTQCLNGKYDAYIDASLTWYQDLIALTTEQYPDLQDVGEWFLVGRNNHFELNRAAVHYYLENEPAKVATEQSVEAWLQLEQQDIKSLSARQDKLGQLALVTFTDRQATPHQQNYQLRSAFAELLSHPKQIDEALQKYNLAIANIAAISCL